MQVTEWDAPQIPQEVLEGIEREAVVALEGRWGNPKAGEPIQVDVIDLETDRDVVSEPKLVASERRMVAQSCPRWNH